MPRSRTVARRRASWRSRPFSRRNRSGSNGEDGDYSPVEIAIRRSLQEELG